MAPGPLFLVGGNEFLPGNEEHDRAFAASASGGPAYVIASAAARQDPDRAVRTAIGWFASLGLDVEELPLRGRRAANDRGVAAAAAVGRGFYLCGGDPGLVVRILADSAVWAAIVGAWRGGAALAGSSAGAMALGEWTLLRARLPGDHRRRFAPALGLIRNVAVVPHFDEFGQSWLPSVGAARPRRDAVILGIDARTAAAWIPGRGRGWTAMGSGVVTLPREVFSPGRRLRHLPAPA